MEKENPDRNKLYKKYRVYSNLQFMFSSFTTVCIFLLVDKFMYLWVGDGLYIGTSCVVLFCCDYFIHSLLQPLGSIYTSTGKFKQDKICMIIAAILNLGISLILVILIGLPGVIIGTLCANIFTYITRTIVMEKKYFGRPTLELVLRPFIQIIILLVEVIMSYFAIKYISISNKLIEFIVCGFVCVIVSNIPNLIICKGLGYFKFVAKKRGSRNYE